MPMPAPAKIKMNAEASSKTKWKLLLHPFHQHSGSNDLAHSNHIICVHHNANHGHRKCPNKALLTGLWPTVHMKGCKGLKMKATKEKPAMQTQRKRSTTPRVSSQTHSQTPRYFCQPALKQAHVLAHAAVDVTWPFPRTEKYALHITPIIQCICRL